MADKNLKWARKSELLSIIAAQDQELEALKEVNHQLQRELAEAKAQLEDRSIRLSKAGSIADASMEINQMFERAQNTANLYLDSIKERKEEQENFCIRMETESRLEADKLVSESQETADMLLSIAQKRSEKIMKKAREESQAYWDDLREKLDAFYESHEGLKEILSIPTEALIKQGGPVFDDIDLLIGAALDYEDQEEAKDE